MLQCSLTAITRPVIDAQATEKAQLQVRAQASMEETLGSGSSPPPSGAPPGVEAVAGAGAGLANDISEHNYFLNAIIQVKQRSRMHDHRHISTTVCTANTCVHGRVPGMQYIGPCSTGVQVKHPCLMQ